MKRFSELYKEQLERNLPEVDGQRLTAEEAAAQIAAVNRMMTREGRDIRVNMKEFLNSPDASWLIKAVIDTRLQSVVEPQLICSQKLAKTITVDGAKLIQFPILGALRAGRVGPGGKYPQDQLSAAEGQTSIEVEKMGLQIPLAEEIIEDSQWDVVGLHIDAGRNAMLRLREEDCFNCMSDMGNVAFDNDIGGAVAHRLDAQTTGKDASGNYNGSISWMDLVDAFGRMIESGYNPTDMAMPPGIWVAFVKDPFMRFIMLMQGNAAPAMGDLGPGAIASNVPFPVNIHISPFIKFATTKTINVLASATDSTGTNQTAPAAELYIVDRNNGLVVAERESMSSEEFEKPENDIRILKFKERRGQTLLNGGKGVVVIKNILLQANEEPLGTWRTQS